MQQLTDTQTAVILLAGITTGLATNWLAGCGVGLLALFAIVGLERGWFTAALPVARRLLAWLRGLFVRKQEGGDSGELYDLVLGVDPLTGEADVESLADLGHIGVYGTTRYGKTTWLHSLIHGLISTHKPSELKLAISDPKTVDYPFYGSLPHLLCPIARDAAETELVIDRLIAEMERRAALFAPYAKTAVCNNITRYAELSGEHLPLILAIFDELADVLGKDDSPVNQKLARLAKLSLAYGIHLVCATQRPSSKVITGEIKSQMSSKFVTWMPTAREYGVVAELPKKMYEDMPRTRGRFMAYSSKGWRFVQGQKIGDKELARLAAHWASRPRQWERAETAVSPPKPEPVSWAKLKENEKIEAMRSWLSGLDYEPTQQEIGNHFGISRQTAAAWREKVMLS